MKFETNINNRVVTVEIVRKRGMKNCYLRVLKKNVIQIRTNYSFSMKQIQQLIEEKSKWLEKHFDTYTVNNLKEDEFFYLGVKHKNLDNRDLDLFYKQEAQRIIPSIVDKYSDIMKLYPTSLKYRKNKRTWGSCNYKNGLNFNTLLAKFPLEVIEYVVIHELAHIKHKNHSRSFWDLVEKYCFDYKRREELLKSFL